MRQPRTSFTAGPLIIVDFGTATTFCAVTKDGEYLGGAICPGIKISAEALFQRASKLPRVELAKPSKVIGTRHHQRHAGRDHLRLCRPGGRHRGEDEEGAVADARVVATGGLAELVSPETRTIQEIKPHLTLEGLRHLFEINR